VWKAVDRKTNEVVALKKIFDAFRNETDAQVIIKYPMKHLFSQLFYVLFLINKQRTYREIVFLQEFSEHPNIIKLFDVIKADNDRDIYLVFEHMGTEL
jgi:mitogen-activated protein kinase 15